mmetsp:Transcript_22719/g.76762  ORF Transcript_22719/g.76762 Transcript_22719/m.76762 type:complete len:277 (+) Transcript_22719:356-1186(+)
MRRLPRHRPFTRRHLTGHDLALARRHAHAPRGSRAADAAPARRHRRCGRRRLDRLLGGDEAARVGWRHRRARGGPGLYRGAPPQALARRRHRARHERHGAGALGRQDLPHLARFDRRRAQAPHPQRAPGGEAAHLLPRAPAPRPPGRGGALRHGHPPGQPGGDAGRHRVLLKGAALYGRDRRLQAHPPRRPGLHRGHLLLRPRIANVWLRGFSAKAASERRDDARWRCAEARTRHSADARPTRAAGARRRPAFALTRRGSTLHRPGRPTGPRGRRK